MRKNNKFYSSLKRGAPTIFTVLGIAGVVATGILSARAANKTRNELQMTDFDEPEEWSVSENFRRGWENYIPPIAVGAVTIICVASSDILNKRAQISLTSAYALLHVFKGGVEQTVADNGTVSGIGTVKWYKSGSTTAVATAKTLSISAKDVANSQAYTCQLED